MSQKQTLVPKLRFPEFRDAWNEAELSDVADIVGERIAQGSLKLQDYVSTENLLSDFGGITLASNLPATGSVTRFRADDVLVSNIRPYLKKVWAADRDGGASNDVIVIRAKTVVHNDYFACVLRSEAFIAHVMKGAKGVKMPRGDIGLMMEYPVSFPSLAEQRRIADCLSSLDELIAAEGRKWEHLRTYKKGLMQQLFPRAGERVPRLRFPEFRNAGEYREVRLQDVTEECTTRNGDYLSPESVMGVTKLEGIIPMKERLIASDIKRYKLVRKDWFAYNPMRLNIGSIARCPNINDVLVSPDYVVFRCLEEPNSAIDPEYLDQFRRSEQWEDFVTESGDGSVRVRIYYKDIARLELMLPSLAEQRRIAECLSALDAQIAAQSEKLVALRTHKKGLMQQLFPSAAEEGAG